MHHVKDIFMLTADHYADLLSQCTEITGKLCHISCLCSVHDHHHIEITVNDGLGNVQNVYLMFCEIRADFAIMPTVSCPTTVIINLFFIGSPPYWLEITYSGALFPVCYLNIKISGFIIHRIQLNFQTYRLISQFRVVIFFAQMSEVNLLNIIMQNSAKKLSGTLVGQMSPLS